MKKNLFDYCEENKVKVSANSKASKILQQGKSKASEASLAMALKTTAAYKADQELKQLCENAIDKAINAQSEGKTPEPPVQRTGRRGEYERGW